MKIKLKLYLKYQMAEYCVVFRTFTCYGFENT